MTNAQALYNLMEDGTRVEVYAHGSYGYTPTVMLQEESRIIGRLARITTEGVWIEEAIDQHAYRPSVLVPFEKLIRIVTP